MRRLSDFVFELERGEGLHKAFFCSWIVPSRTQSKFFYQEKIIFFLWRFCLHVQVRVWLNGSFRWWSGKCHRRRDVWPKITTLSMPTTVQVKAFSKCVKKLRTKLISEDDCWLDCENRKFGIKLYSEWFRWFWYWVFEIKMILMILILKFGNQNDFWNFDFTLSKIKMIFMILTMDFSFSKSWQWFWQLIFSKVMILTNNDFAEKWNHTNPALTSDTSSF